MAAGKTAVGKLAQASEPDRQPRDDSDDDAEKAKAAADENRLAQSCLPLKDRLLATLRDAGAAVASFNQAAGALFEIGKQMPGLCPQSVMLFSGSIVNVVNCYNEASLYELSDGSRVIYAASTRTFDYGVPKTVGARIIGLTDVPYYCLKSTSPIEVWAGMQIDALARRDQDPSDRGLAAGDLVRRKARELAAIGEEIAGYDASIKADPNDKEARRARALAREKKGDYTGAAADFSKLIDIEPDNAEWWNGRCYELALENKAVRRALLDCEKSLQLRPGDANTFDSRAFAHLRLGELDEAIADYSAALNINSQLATSFYGRGLAKRMKKDFRGAGDDMAQARTLNGTIDDQFAPYGIK